MGDGVSRGAGAGSPRFLGEEHWDWNGGDDVGHGPPP